MPLARGDLIEWIILAYKVPELLGFNRLYRYSIRV